MRTTDGPDLPVSSKPISGLAVSGLAQIALGAVTGFAYAAAVYREGGLARYGVQAPGRIRQLHLDLIMMGGLVTATSAAVPGLPRAVVVPLATGCWTNALAFAPPAFYPEIEKSRVFRALVGVSFVTTAASWVAAAVVANRRRRRGSAGRRG